MSKSTKSVPGHESVGLAQFGSTLEVEGVEVQVCGSMLILDGIPDLFRVEVAWPTSSDQYAEGYYAEPMAKLTASLEGMGMTVQAKVKSGGLVFEAQMPELVAAHLQIAKLRGERNQLLAENMMLAEAGMAACQIGKQLAAENDQLRQEMQGMAFLLKAAGVVGAAQERQLIQTTQALEQAAVENMLQGTMLEKTEQAARQMQAQGEHLAQQLGQTQAELRQSESDLQATTVVAQRQAADLRKAHNFKQAVLAAVAEHDGQPEVSDDAEVPVCLPIGDGTVNVDCGDCNDCVAKAA